jgi:hypothetical protein
MLKKLTTEEKKLAELTAYLQNMIGMTSEVPNKMHDRLIGDYMKLAFEWGKMRGRDIESAQHRFMFHKDWITK